MRCNCIKEVNEKIREATGDPEASLCLVLASTNNKLEIRLGIPFKFRKKKPNGEFAKEKETSILLEKCPFCGKLQVDDDEEKEVKP